MTAAKRERFGALAHRSITRAYRKGLLTPHQRERWEAYRSAPRLTRKLFTEEWEWRTFAHCLKVGVIKPSANIRAFNWSGIWGWLKANWQVLLQIALAILAAFLL